MPNSRETPLVSVVIPTYGRSETLLEAIDSVREQTYPSIELVVVDDCSPEPVEQFVESVSRDDPKDIRLLRHDENRGAAVARRTGIEATTGEYVAFLDDDDRWDPEKVYKQVTAIERGGPMAGVAYSGMKIVDDTGTVMRTHEPTFSGDLTKTLLCRNAVGSYSNVLVKRAAIEDVGLPDPRFPSWQDLEWYIRLSTKWEFVPVPEPLSIIRQEDDRSRISDNFETLRSETYPLFLKEFRPVAARYGKLFERKMRSWAAFRVGGYNALRTGRYRDARRFLATAVRLYPFKPKFWLYFGVALGGRRIHEAAVRLKRSIFE